MLRKATITGLALAGAVAATGASAHGSFGHTHHSTGTAQTYGSTYTAPTINLGPIEHVQPSSTVQYVQPATTTTWAQPTTTYVQPTTSYVQPATTSTYSYTYPSSTYTAPSYTTPSYAAQPTYTAPSYSTTYSAPSYVAPAYVAPRFDATDRVSARIDRQRSRIRNAMDRGDLREGERRKLRRKMRDIRGLFRDYRANDGIIDGAEQAELMRKLDRQSRRIRRLANNARVAGPLVSPYAPTYYRY